MSVHVRPTVFRAGLFALAAAVLTAAIVQTFVFRKAPVQRVDQTSLHPAPPRVDHQAAVRTEWPIQRVQLSVSPEATAQQASPQVLIQQDREVALKLIPDLLEMGVEVMPMGPKDDGRTVLSAVNGLRRQQGLPPFDRLSQAVADYVDGKVDEYRERQANVLRIQIALDALGFNPGPMDGVLGPRTLQAIKKYQQMSGMAVTGELTDDQIDALEMLSFDKGAGTAPGG